MHSSTVLFSSIQALLPLAALGLVSACNSRTAPNTDSTITIVGGKSVTSATPGRASVVGLVGRGGGLCTGTLVSANVVATAGHCLLDGGMDKVVFGEDVDSPNAVTREIVSSDSLLTDIDTFPSLDVGWVKFKGKLPAGYKPAKILDDVSKLKAGQILTLIGFGKTGDSEDSPAGKRLTVNSIFSKFVDNEIYKNIIVVGPNLGKGDCHGDSGGPTFARVDGEVLLVSTLSGIDEKLTPEMTCESGHTVHNFLGAYKSWIESSSGATLL